jgi:hypothetical protein
MLTTLGPEWEQWQALAAEWMATQHLGITHKRAALTRFFESYLLGWCLHPTDARKPTSRTRQYPKERRAVETSCELRRGYGRK